LLLAVIRENLGGTLNRAAWLDGGRTLAIPLPAGGELHAPVLRRLSLGRLDFGPGLLLQRQAQQVPVGHPRQLLELIGAAAAGTDPEAETRWQRFGLELENSAANYALALVGAGKRRAEVEAWARQAGAATSLEWVEKQLETDATFSPLAFYEQWVVDGHPLHPGAKIKLGMEPADVIRYSPEWGACPGLRVVAVARRACRVIRAGTEGPRSLLGREQPGLESLVEAHLQRGGHDPADFELIPVHPWQYEHTLPRLHAEAIRRGEVVLIPAAHIPAAALMSVRTLAPLQRRGEGRHHIKTAVAVQTTGAVRTVSPNAAENGPTLSRILDEVRVREAGFGGRFGVLTERVGQGKHLAAIFRENPENHAGPGEVALPASALVAESPVGGGPVAGELLDRFARCRGLADLAAAAAFVKQYAAVAVPGFLTLMSRYGIGLEGHLQNSVAVFRDGEPVRLLVRDFGGVRIFPERLRRQRIEAAFYPGSATVTDDVEDLRNKVYYAFFQNHLGELIGCLARRAGAEEGPLWGAVAGVCRTAFRELAADAAIAGQAAADEAALFRPALALKAMTTMRLRGEVTRYAFAAVPNPLAGSKETA
jgi:siderophore synthetase component